MGATVIHKSPFQELPSHRNNFELDEEFINEWVAPYYMKIGKYYNDDWINSIKAIRHQITPEITLGLLGDFNWRTRLVGAYFSAIKGYTEQLEIIGTHFLKSEVCCVGHIYSIVLAYYNTDTSINYLEKYLDYYLQKPELYFDQTFAMNALAYTDCINGTNRAKHYAEDWEKFLVNQKKEQQKRASQLSKYLNLTDTKEEIKIHPGIDFSYIKHQVDLMKELRAKSDK